MFDKKMMKKMALKSLMESLMSDNDYEKEEGCKDENCPIHGKGESKMKATIMADSEEGLIEGAKKLPEILSKSEEYMKSRMSELEDSPSKKKKK